MRLALPPALAGLLRGLPSRLGRGGAGTALLGAALGLGATALYLLLALLEGLLKVNPLGSACIEECAKAGLIVAAALLGARRAGAGRAAMPDSRRNDRTAFSYAVRYLNLSLVLILLFATVENLAYFLAYPSGDMFGRLIWSEPVHLVAALAEALGAAAALRQLSRRGGEARVGGALLRWLPWFAAGLAWHLGANALAGGLAGPAFREGPPLLAGALANLLVTLILARIYVRRVIIGGFLHGTT